jgi:hypothetical protein
MDKLLARFRAWPIAAQVVVALVVGVDRTVIIQRGSQTIEIDSSTAPACGPTGTIEPGDTVTAHLGRRVSGSQEYVVSDPPGTGPTSDIHVGTDAHC